MPLDEEIINLIGLPESNRLRYEPLLPSSSEFGRLICAYANTAGGVLILGVLNKNNKISVTGLSGDFQVNTVLKNATSMLQPPVSLESGFVQYKDKQLFAIKVEKASQATSFNNIVYGIKSKKIYQITPQSALNVNSSSMASTAPVDTKGGQNIFISYNWNHKVSANRLYDFLKAEGYYPSMDDHMLTYKDSISTFMESIRASDFAVLIISDEYLKSENCMIEVMHVLKDRNSRNKILPIRHEDVKILKSFERIKYVEYWKSQVEEKEKMLNGIDPTTAIEEFKKLKDTKRIYNEVGDFLSDISDMITSTIEEQERYSFKDIVNYIETHKK